jgi:hypothetical protein
VSADLSVAGWLVCGLVSAECDYVKDDGKSGAELDGDGLSQDERGQNDGDDWE